MGAADGVTGSVDAHPAANVAAMASNSGCFTSFNDVEYFMVLPLD
jgi:hypothetical protein